MLEAFTTWRRTRRRSAVPASWQTSQSVAADLHRRMHRAIDRTRRTVADLGRRGVATSGYDRLCDELDTAAIAIDVRLVQASRLPHKARHKALLELRYRIADLERTGDRIANLALDAASPLVAGVDDALRTINERLGHLTEAREELKELGGE